MKRVSIKQKIVLEVIEDFIAKNGMSPTIREIADILEQSTHAVFEKLQGLEKFGYIKTHNGKARSIVVLKHVEEPSDDDN